MSQFEQEKEIVIEVNQSDSESDDAVFHPVISPKSNYKRPSVPKITLPKTTSQKKQALLELDQKLHPTSKLLQPQHSNRSQQKGKKDDHLQFLKSPHESDANSIKSSRSRRSHYSKRDLLGVARKKSYRKGSSIGNLSGHGGLSESAQSHKGINAYNNVNIQSADPIINKLDASISSSDKTLQSEKIVEDVGGYFQDLENKEKLRLHEMHLKEIGETIPPNAMQQLNIEFEKYDSVQHIQMFVDKESQANISEDQSQKSNRSKDIDVRGSITTMQTYHDVQVREMLAVLEQPKKHRSLELVDGIMHHFKALDAFTTLIKMNAKDGVEFPEHSFQKILQSCQIKKMKKDDFVVYQGTTGDEFYIILSGAVSFFVKHDEKTDMLNNMKQKHMDPLSVNKRAANILNDTRNSILQTGGQTLIKINSLHSMKQPNSIIPSIVNSTLHDHSNDKIIPCSREQLIVNNHIVSSQKLSYDDPGEVQVMVITKCGEANQGNVFGEKAITSRNNIRMASVKCKKDCIFITLQGSDYLRYLNHALEKLDDDKIQFLRSTYLFNRWSKAVARNSMRSIKTHILSRGHTVIKQEQHQPFLFIIYKGSVELSIRVKKPYTEMESQKQLLLEKYKLKDGIHGIIRHTNKTVEEQNCAIEGDDTGMMGAHENWPQIPKDADQYIERMDAQRLEQEENHLRQRRLQSDDTKQKVTNDKLEYWVVNHKLIKLQAGQVFGEEGVMYRDCLAKYTVTVTSEKAEFWTISEIELNKRLRQIPETRVDLKSIMQSRAKLVYQICKTQPSWSLPNWEAYARFYIDSFYKKSVEEEFVKVLEETPENKLIIQETKVFRKQFVPQHKMVYGNASRKDKEIIDKKVQHNLELLNARVDDIDMLQGAVDIHPMQRATQFMPQMENKKRYTEVQKVVSPDFRKGQKAHELFKEDTFIKQTIAERAYTKKHQNKKGSMSRPDSSATHLKGISKKSLKGLVAYDKALDQLKNVEGGSNLVNGRLFDQRKVMEQIVKGYPMVKQQKDIYLRDLALKQRDENGVPIHKTAEMLLTEKYVNDLTEYEKSLYRILDESPNPMQLINILKRKLSINDPENGAKNVKILETMLAREPLRRFVLYAKKCYYSNNIFDQIGKIHDLQGNEKAVYKDDQEYQIMMNAKKIKSPPKKISYFQQTLQRKYDESLYQQNQESMQVMQQKNLMNKFQQKAAADTMIHVNSFQFYQQQQQQPNPYSEAGKVSLQPYYGTANQAPPNFESQKLQKLFSKTGHSSRPCLSNTAKQSGTSLTINQKMQTGQTASEFDENQQKVLTPSQQQKQQQSEYKKGIILSDRNNATERLVITPQQSALPGGETEEEHEDNLDPLDVKLVQADIEVTRKQPFSNMTSSASIAERETINVYSQYQNQQRPSQISVAAFTANRARNRKQSEPLFAGNHTSTRQQAMTQHLNRPSTGMLWPKSQLESGSGIPTMNIKQNNQNRKSVMSGNPTNRGVQRHLGVNRGGSSFNGGSILLNPTSMSQLGSKTGLNHTLSSQEQMLQLNSQRNQNLLTNQGMQFSKVRTQQHQNNFNKSQERHQKKSIGENLTQATGTSSVGYSRASRLASQMNSARPREFKMQVASLRRRKQSNH